MSIRNFETENFNQWMKHTTDNFNNRKDQTEEITSHLEGEPFKQANIHFFRVI